MKAFGIFMVGAMAVAGGIAAATYLAKKKLDRENEDNYYDDWDSDNIDDDWDFDFDEDMEVEDEPAADTAVFGGNEKKETGTEISDEKDLFGSSDVFETDTADELNDM